MDQFRCVEVNPEDERENYSKVIFHKVLTVTVNEDEKGCKRKSKPEVPPKPKHLTGLFRNKRSSHISPEYLRLIQEKAEVKQRIIMKIDILRRESKVLSDEKTEMDLAGKRLYARISRHLSILEAEKFSAFLEEIQQITKLKVGLALRLQKIENGYSKTEDYEASRNYLIQLHETIKQKRLKLSEQIREAESLQKNTDRRKIVLETSLKNVISDSSLADEFLLLLRELPRIIREQREIDHKISLGEEQLKALDSVM